MAGKGEVGIASRIHRPGSAGCNYPARVQPRSPVTLLHPRPPRATSNFAFDGFLFLAVHIRAKQWVFGGEAALVARLLFPAVLCTAVGPSSPVADQLRPERGKVRGKQLNLVAALCWTNKITIGDEGQGKLVASSPVLPWVGVQRTRRRRRAGDEAPILEERGAARAFGARGASRCLAGTTRQARNQALWEMLIPEISLLESPYSVARPALSAVPLCRRTSAFW